MSACGGGSSDDSSAPADPATTADASTDTEDAGVNSLLNGTVPTVTGSQVDLASFAGQDVLVWVWAPW